MSATSPGHLLARLVAASLPILLLLACAVAPPPTPSATPAASASPGGPAVATASPTGGATSQPLPSASPTPSTPSVPPSLPTLPSPSPSPHPSPSATPRLPFPTPPASPAAGFEARLQRILDAQREARAIPGLGAAVLFADGTRWTAGSGLSQLERRRAASGDTPFVVGSISKTFVAATILQLAEEGRLDLDDPLSRWLPDYPRAERITLRQLLDHSSGVFNYFEHHTYNRLVFGPPEETWTPAEILSTFHAAPYFDPGTGYHYSNTGYVLLGMVIEEITANSLGEEYAARFFEPLGMADTFFQGDGPPPRRSAHGYLVPAAGPRLINDGSDYRPTTSAATVAWAAGAVVASANDLATWADALYGGSVLQADSLAAMTDFSNNPYARGTYALGTRTRFIEGRRVVGHTGSLRGFAAAMWHFPDEGITVVVLSNRGRLDVNPIADRLAISALRSAGHAAP